MHLPKQRCATVLAAVALLAVMAWAGRQPPPSGDADWATYGGQPADMHFSTLKQIDRSNVVHLQKAWSYDVGEPGGLETSPIEIAGVVYANTPEQQVIALDGATGQRLWEFDSGIAARGANRGLTYWAAPDGTGRRLFASVNNFIYALDPATGRPIASFGDHGRIDLRDGLGRPPAQQSIALDTPGAIYKNLLIVGGRVAESLPASPGDIRAFNVLTGALVWAFHSLPHPGDPGYSTWPKNAWKTVGSANNWAGMAVDTEHGIVYVPTGSAAFDFYGGNRLGADHYADSLVALDAATGKILWYFQDVHHDLWDRDFPSPPTLVTVERNGKAVPAVAQATKQGVVYVFNRLTGASLFPIVEKRVPPSTTPGEQAWPTQPWPTLPAPFARQRLTPDALTERTPAVHAWALKQFSHFISNGQFVPLSVGQETVVFPGFDGGAEWGGSAYDPATHLLFVNSNDVAWTGSLAKNAPVAGAAGRSLYLTNCANCHRDNLSGTPPEYPSLVGIGTRLTPAAIATQIRKGGGRMPGFPALTAGQLDTLVAYLNNPRAAAGHGPSGGGRAPGGIPGISAPASAPQVPMPYRFTGYHKFLDPDGYPAVKPPWGTLNAINLDTGAYAWKIPLGYYPELATHGHADTGTENYGGPIVTAGGLLFIGATNYDKQFRAFNQDTGQLLWQATLPFAGNATPITYEIAGRQYVLIAAGGGKARNAASGSVYVAFALPRQGGK